MKSRALEIAAALALIVGAGAAQAQGERKHEERKSPPAHKAAPNAAKPDTAQTDRAVDADRTAAQPNPAATALLILSDAERAFVLDSVDVQGDSTLALGFLTVGADVPRTIELKGFPQAVLAKVSKLKDYKYFSAEGRIAIVDPTDAKVEMVIEPRR
jgi:hypothetical protein